MTLRTLTRVLLVALVAVLLALPAGGCARDADEPDEPVPTPEPTPTPEPEPEPVAETIDVLVYLLDGETLAVVRRHVDDTVAVASAAMGQLLAGPEGRETELDFGTEIPDGTALLGLDVDDGVATVDLSSEFESGGGSLSMRMRVAQVVYTLTQFETVDRVAFMIDGSPVEAIGGEGIMVSPPVGREDFRDDILPLIFVEEPAPFDEVTSPLRLHGYSNTFEATFIINVVDPSGRIVYEDFTTATAGSGTWGTFDVTVEYDIEREGVGALIVFEESAKDGSQVNLKEIPLEMRE